MSYYNYIFKKLEIKDEEFEIYKKDKSLLVFFEKEKGFIELKEAVGVSCLKNDMEVIILKDLQEGSSMLRPSMLLYPEGTFINEAGCFIKLSDLHKSLNEKRIKDLKITKEDLDESLDTYLSQLKNNKNAVLMPC